MRPPGTLTPAVPAVTPLTIDGVYVHAVDALHRVDDLRPFTGSRPDLIVGQRASDERGFEMRQMGGKAHPGAVGQDFTLARGFAK